MIEHASSFANSLAISTISTGSGAALAPESDDLFVTSSQTASDGEPVAVNAHPSHQRVSEPHYIDRGLPRAVHGDWRLVAKRKKRVQVEWRNAFYRTIEGAVPALAWFEVLPKPRREQLLAWAETIRRWPEGPYAFPPGPTWQPMRDEAAGCFEIRDEHDKKLYRLFCVIDRNAVENGLTHPVVCYLDGATKAVGSALPKATYQRLGALRRAYLATNPRRVLERLP